ncbi:MAG: DUF1080 domain-containing protein, partial [Opitutaceae bacterium]|nr:DUF1080 domain-containing protein [Opitutaceae bacterium]
MYAPDLANADYKPGAWQNTDGILKGSGLIWTRARYDNFYLSLEFRCQKNADGGLYIRASDTQDHAQNSLEIQIAQGDRPDGNDRALVGALYDCAAPSRQIEIEPGAWYQLLLMARNNDLVIYINDERLVHANLDKWTTPGKNPDGTANQYPKALKTFARSGPIGLHGADGKIEYRNLFIDPLPPPPATTARPTAAATPPAAPATATQS